MIILSFWKIGSGIYFNFSKEFTIAITCISPWKLEKYELDGKKEEQSSLYFIMKILYVYQRILLLGWR